MGSRGGKGGEDQIEIIGFVPGGEGDGDGIAISFGVKEAINGQRKGLQETVAGDNVRETLRPIRAEGASKNIRERVAEPSASRPSKVQGSDAKG